MKISFITLFPEYYEGFKNHSIIKRALDKKAVQLETIDIRKFSDKSGVDDYVYGGGPGMLMKVDSIVKAINSIKNEDSIVIMTSPMGKTYNQKKAKNYANNVKHLIIVCGHYEGIDARIKNYIDEEISIGEFITTGGETISMLIADSIIRLIPNVIKQESHEAESFSDMLLEEDQFTKPVNFEGHKVPKVLLSGNHEEIAKWRKNSAYENTIIYYKNKRKE